MFQISVLCNDGYSSIMLNKNLVSARKGFSLSCLNGCSRTEIEPLLNSFYAGYICETKQFEQQVSAVYIDKDGSHTCHG